MKEFWTTALKIVLRVLEEQDQKKISADAEYTRIANHLDYLDEKIFKFLSLYIQLATAIIGGSFFLSTYELDSPRWAYRASNSLMIMVSFGGILFIVHHLVAWKGYRDELTKFIGQKKKNRVWYLSEAIQCMFILSTCVGFYFLNPLNPKVYKHIGGPKAPSSVSAPVSRFEVNDSNVTVTEVLPLAPISAEVQAAENLIKNGSFGIPLEDPTSGWGAGLYTSQFRNIVPHSKIVWINFLDADIDTRVVSTDAGNALKIINRTGVEPNRVGVMEQIVNVSPGVYELSFLAKGDGLEPNSLQITTTLDWRITDSDGTHRGIELKEGGSFEWKKIVDDKIKIDENGPITLSVTSKGKGTLYITDLVLRKVS